MAPAVGRSLLAAVVRRGRIPRNVRTLTSVVSYEKGVEGSHGFGERKTFFYPQTISGQNVVDKHKFLIPIGARGFASDGFPDHEVLTMPSLSPTMTQGNLVEWKKKEGEEVSAGDVLCVIETDKATLDNESQEDGFLAKILIDSGSKDVPVGTPIAIMAELAEHVPKFANYSSQETSPSSPSSPLSHDEKSSSPPSSSPSPPPPPPPPPPSGPEPSLLGPSVKRLLRESGIDSRTLIGTGPRGIITKGDVLLAIEKGGSPSTLSPPPPPSPSSPSSPSSPLSPSSPSSPSKASETVPKKTTSSKTLPSQGSYEDLPNSQIRKVIAKRLLESKTGTPHFYATAEAYIDSTLALRKQLKEKHGTSVSVNDFVVKAVAMALREVSQANAFFDEKKGDVVTNNSVDVAVAVATDRGLMTPIVKNADTKSLSSISKEIKSLAERAREGKLKPEEYQGGTFSISNLGMFSVDRFKAIINPPQAGILAIGRGTKIAVWEENEDGTGKPVTVTKMEVTLSADQRVMDGDVAASFLEAVTSKLSNPHNLLL